MEKAMWAMDSRTNSSTEKNRVGCEDYWDLGREHPALAVTENTKELTVAGILACYFLT